MLKKWRRRHLQKKLESIDIDINHLTEKIGPIAQRYVALGERVKREAQNDRRSFTECVNDDITYYFDLPLILSPLLRNLDWLKDHLLTGCNNRKK